MAIAPLIARIVTPRILDAISEHFRSTPENEKKDFLGLFKFMKWKIETLRSQGETALLHVSKISKLTEKDNIAIKRPRTKGSWSTQPLEAQF